MDLRIVHIGNVARKEGAVYAPAAHARTYNGLARTLQVSIFGRYIDAQEDGFEFLTGDRLDAAIDLDVAHGNTPHTPFARFAFHNLRDLVRLVAFCRHEAHYVVFLPSFVGAVACLLLSCSTRRRTMGLYVGGHFGLEEKHEGRKGWLKNVVKALGAKGVDALVHRAVRQADYVITSSYKVRHDAGTRPRVVMTPPAIQVTEQDLDAQETCDDGTCRDLIYCGELRHAKGVFVLLEAFDRLVREAPRACDRLVYIGSGYAEVELRRDAARRGLAEKVVFTGQLHDAAQLKALIRQGRVFALPSFSEGFPRAAYESFALGVPVVLTPVGGIPFLVQDGQQVLFARPGDPEDLKNKIRLVAEDPAVRQRLISRARALMREVIFPRIRKHGSLDRLIIRMIEASTGGAQ